MNESLVSPPSDMKLLTQGTQTGLWRTLDDVARRGLDVIIALLGALILSPLFILIAILIHRDSPGPVFYWGERIGRNPKTGVEVPIAPRRVLTFRASQIMRERIARAG